jgi:hypothetical protein
MSFDEIGHGRLAKRSLAAVLPGRRERFAVAAVEALVADPIARIEEIYAKLEIGEFAPVRNAMVAELARRRGYQAKGALPSPSWQSRIRQQWAPILEQHAALSQP